MWHWLKSIFVINVSSQECDWFKYVIEHFVINIHLTDQFTDSVVREIYDNGDIIPDPNKYFVNSQNRLLGGLRVRTVRIQVKSIPKLGHYIGDTAESQIATTVELL